MIKTFIYIFICFYYIYSQENQEGIFKFNKDLDDSFQEKLFWDELSKIGNFGKGRFRMTFSVELDSKSKGLSKFVFDLYRDEQKNKSVFIFTSPKEYYGSGFFQDNNQLFHYNKKTKVFKEVVNNKKDEHQAHVIDYYFYLNDKSSKFNISNVNFDIVDSIEAWVVELITVKPAAQIYKRNVWVSKKDNTILKIQNYSKNGRALDMQLFSDYLYINKGIYPSKLMFVNYVHSENVLQSLLSFSTDIKEDVFSKDFFETFKGEYSD